MDGLRSRDLLVAVLAVVAVILAGAAAAPLFDVEQGAPNPPGVQEPNGSGPQLSFEDTQIPIEPVVAVVVVLGLLAIVAQFVADPKQTFLQLLGLSVVLIAAFVLFDVLRDAVSQLNQSQPSMPPGDSLTPATTATNESGFGQGETNPLSLPADEIAAIVLVAGLLGVVVLLAWRSGTIQSVLPGGVEPESEELDEGLGEIGDLAGDVADDVEAATTTQAADNAIYRAWREMVDLLDAPDPQSGTPRQFADAAVEAGMDPDDVTVLTRTFEEVRYGDAALSEERRESAVAALRRIERTHGSDDADATSESDGEEYGKTGGDSE